MEIYHSWGITAEVQISEGAAKKEFLLLFTLVQIMSRSNKVITATVQEQN